MTAHPFNIGIIKMNKKEHSNEEIIKEVNRLAMRIGFLLKESVKNNFSPAVGLTGVIGAISFICEKNQDPILDEFLLGRVSEIKTILENKAYDKKTIN